MKNFKGNLFSSVNMKRENAYDKIPMNTILQRFEVWIRKLRLKWFCYNATNDNNNKTNEIIITIITKGPSYAPKIHTFFS